MKWKIFITAFISVLFLGLPANIIGCAGGETDPYDYYISFFHQDLPEDSKYHSFYYSSYKLLYDHQENETATRLLSKEWAAYCGLPVTVADAMEFVFDFSLRHVDSIYAVNKNRKRLRKAAALEENSMSNYFLQHKDQEALQYISYAKRVQPFVIGEADAWQAISRDSLAMDSLIGEGQHLFSKAKTSFIKLKYGYQLVRLAHYSKRYNDAIKFYDAFVAGNKTQSVLQSMSLALKGGACYHLGAKKEAALLFSKVFRENEIQRLSNYFGFSWSSEWVTEKEAYLEYCKTDDEKVSMLSLFALSGGKSNQIQTLAEIYHLDPGNKILEVLVVREINKLEETYLTPIINSKKGGPESWMFAFVTADTSVEKKQLITELSGFLHSAAQKGNVSNPGLFEVSAAYASIIIQDFAKAKLYLEAAALMTLSTKLKDQWELINVLLTINSTDRIDAAFEQQILPSIKWLQEKAAADSVIKTEDGWNISNWKNYYRNLLAEVIAKRYHQQGDFYKEVFALGSSKMIYDDHNRENYNRSLIFLQEYLESKDVKRLYDLLNSSNRTAYENYLINFNTIEKNDVINLLGTVFLRDYNYSEAIEWFKKDNSSDIQIDVNPFIDILYDRVWPLDGEHFSTTKLAFAAEMLRLEKLSVLDKNNAAKYYYKMALGMYNMTYHGRAWSLVEYGRNGNDHYWLDMDSRDDKLKDSPDFKKEYFNCYRAHDYFKKAMDATNDKNFKARCLFKMAKSYQKTLSGTEDGFANSKYFPQFVKEYSNTTTYKEALTSCSYLRDFISKK